MKNLRLILSLACVLFSVSVMAQVRKQTGYVKTPGHLETDGRIIAGRWLPDVAITLGDGRVIRSESDGSFTISRPKNEQTFCLRNVQKYGYMLTDPNVLGKQYSYSTKPLILVMETPVTQLKYQLAQEKELREISQRELKKREAELSELRSKNELTEQEYEQKLQELLARQETYEKLISEMAKRFAKMDFDISDDFNRRIADCILNGRLEEADSLIRTKGDSDERLQRIKEEIALEAQHDEEIKKQIDLANDRIREEAEELAKDCNNIGVMYANQGEYAKALEYYQQALGILKELLGEKHPDVATSYNNIGDVYYNQGEYAKALEYYQQALGIQKEVLGEQHPCVKATQENISKTEQQLKKD